MKILSLHIYGFGKFEDKYIELDENASFQTIFGENEAGKSTFMAFIQSILFGFPTRTQAENRYEPKTGSRYGGKLTIQRSDETITIERIAGRAAGEVTIYYEDGTSGGEADLNDIIGGFDRSIYQAIFSFGLKGLQTVDNIKADDLGQYLFSAGAAGSQAIFELEKKLDKSLDDLYKPNGRKPRLNQRLSKLEALQRELKQWQEKLSEYNHVVDESEDVKTKLAILETNRVEVGRQFKEYEKKQLLKPYVEERKKWLINLNQIDNYKPFPIDGLERLEKYQLQLAPISAQYQLIVEKLNKVEELLLAMEPTDDSIKYEQKVQAVKERFKAIQLQEKELERVNMTVSFEEEELHHIIERLGSRYTEEVIEELDTSLLIRERLKELVANEQQLRNQQSFLDEQFKVAKYELEIAEQNLNRLVHSQQVKSSHQHKEAKNNSVLILSMILAILAIGIVFYLFNDIIYTVFTIILVGLVAGYLIKERKRAKRDITKEKEKLLETERLSVSQKEKAFEKAVVHFEAWERQLLEAQEKLEIFCEQHRFPIGLTGEQLLEAFQSIEIAKKRIRTRNHARMERQRLQDDICSFSNEVYELAEHLSIEETSVERMLEYMDASIRKAKERYLQFEQQTNLEQDLLNQKLDLKKQLEYFEGKINELYASANVQTEEEFRQKGKAYLLYVDASSQLQTVENHLQTLIQAGEESYIEEVENEAIDYNAKLQEIDATLKRIKQEEKELQLKLADLTVQITNLENGTSYSEVLHQYSMERSAFQEEVKEWTTYRVARDLLQKTKDFYREVRLPQVIEKAEDYFSYLTIGRYEKIVPPTNENGFLVVRNDGIHFKPEELSQATTEQLYLSIRLALANSFTSTSRFPILIDDSFVNFDKHRTRRVFEVLRKVSNEHQILFFTCHDHLLEHFHTKETISIG